MLHRISDSILDHPHRWALAVFMGTLIYVLLVSVRPAVDSFGAAPARLESRVADLQSAVELVPGQIADRVLSAAVPLIDKHAGLIRRDLFGQVEALRLEVLGPEGRWVSLQSAVLARVDEGVRIIEATRRENVAPVLTAAIGVISDLRPTLRNAESITGHADEAAAILFRRDALPAQVLGVLGGAKVTLGETAQTMRTVRSAAPMFVSQGQAITNEFLSIGSNINRLTKPHWYDRLLGYGLNGVVLYRNLNPATNLTIKGAQIVSSQK